MRNILLIIIICLLNNVSFALNLLNNQTDSKMMLKFNLSPTSYLGSAKKFRVTATYLEDGHIKDISRSVKWTSSDPTVATINDSGFATGLKPGITEISATFGVDRTFKATFTVTKPLTFISGVLDQYGTQATSFCVTDASSGNIGLCSDFDYNFYPDHLNRIILNKTKFHSTGKYLYLTTRFGLTGAPKGLFYWTINNKGELEKFNKLDLQLERDFMEFQSLIFHPVSPFAYVIVSYKNDIQLYRTNPNDPNLEYVGDAGFGENPWGGPIALSSDGNYLYGGFSDYYNENGYIRYCAVDANSGSLKNCQTTNLKTLNISSILLQDLKFNSDGSILYIATNIASLYKCNVNTGDGSLSNCTMLMAPDTEVGRERRIAINEQNTIAYVLGKQGGNFGVHQCQMQTGGNLNCTSFKNYRKPYDIVLN